MAGKKHREKNRIAILRHYGGENPSCACCGISEEKFLALDHIGGGGLRHRTETSNVYAKVIQEGFPGSLRILCHCCNASIGRYGYCPHRPNDEAFHHKDKKKIREPKPIDENLDKLTTMKKKCFQCGKEFPLNENYFYKHKKAADNYLGKCRWCAMAYAANIAESNRRRLRRQTLAAYGGSEPKCQCCGESHQEFLEIDHIAGGGSRDRRENGDLYTHLRQQGFPPGYQILCSCCNMAKGLYGQCPHIAD